MQRNLSAEEAVGRVVVALSQALGVIGPPLRALVHLGDEVLCLLLFSLREKKKRDDIRHVLS